MKYKLHIFLWFGFVATGLLTWIIYVYRPDFFPYLVTRPVLAVLQGVLGLWLLKTAHFAWHTVILMVIGIIAGQWWVS